MTAITICLAAATVLSVLLYIRQRRAYREELLQWETEVKQLQEERSAWEDREQKLRLAGEKRERTLALLEESLLRDAAESAAVLVCDTAENRLLFGESHWAAMDALLQPEENENMMDCLDRLSRDGDVQMVHHEQTNQYTVKACDREEQRAYVIRNVTDARRLSQAQLLAGRHGLLTTEYLEQQGALWLENGSLGVVYLKLVWSDLRQLAGGSEEGFLQSVYQALRELSGPELLFAWCRKGELLGICPNEAALEQKLPELTRTLTACVQALDPVGKADSAVILGTAQAPRDGERYQALCDAARLAAYDGWKNGRGGICPAQPAADAMLLEGWTAFDELVKTKAVKFMLQPIVASANAKICGYELTMTSRHPLLTRWEDVLDQARLQGRMRELEALLLFGGLEYFTGLVKKGRLVYTTKLWIPGGGDCCLGDRETAAFEERFYDYLSNIVTWVDGCAWPEVRWAEVCRERARAWNGLCAVEHDGAAGLLAEHLKPDVIVLPGELTAGVGKNKTKQTQLKKLVTQAHGRKQQVLARGIENRADLQALIGLGVEYLQGDYLGRAEASPAELNEKRVQEIGEAQYGKRG